MNKVIPPEGDKIWKWIWILWLTLVCVLSLMPTGSSLNHSVFKWPHLDKVAHIIMYAVMSFTMMKFLVYKGAAQPVIYVLIFCIAWGIGIEMLQSSKIINRDFEIADIIANIIGTFAGIGINKFLKF